MQKSIWDEKPHLIARAQAMEAEGLNCRQIAIALGNGITRSSVLGKLYRLRGMKPAEGREHNNPRKLPMTSAPSKPKKPSPITLPLPHNDPNAVLKPSPLPPEENIVTPWNMLNIGPRQCRYPYGSGAETSLCGEPATKGPYCSKHHAKCLVPAKKPEAGK